MLRLRLTQTREETGKFRVEIALEGDDFARRTARTRPFDFQLTPQEHEKLRWYLEDYLQYPQDPAPAIAARVEERMAEVGTNLFKIVFHCSDDARDLWANLRERLNDTRVEIITSVEEATSVPWELLRDPKTDEPLALRAQSFVRAQPEAAQAPRIPRTTSGPIRILLVICRPGGREDVPFRSVASRLIEGLTEEARELFRLDVLRPPTFGQLASTLRAAKAKGEPYHVVHFDGHGMYAETPETKAAAEWLKKLMPLMLSGPRRGAHGYLVFENPKVKENIQLVDGPGLGKLLVETDVPALVLNACRSAYADARRAPAPAGADEEDPHARVRALGSLAQEVMDAGVAGVVAMRYNVYVVTAARFVADMYASLTQGHAFGEAATLGRKQLADDPLREIAFDPRPLRDWCVPVVYEAAPIALFSRPPKKRGQEGIRISRAGKAAGEARGLDPTLPKRPDVGFFGRDETLLALDRAFDSQRIVLLHGFAGSGKTATAAEFARWYSLTGGLNAGRVLFSSFQHHTPLRTVLGHLGEVFGSALEGLGINWSAITETEEMRRLALEVLRKVPVLWIWDNVEPVAGFPKGTKSDWSDDEQEELVDFLRDAQGTKAKFLLTSRREEKQWLGELPARITIPRMPMQERVQMARALAEKRGRRLAEVEDWRPLLEFTQGNPLTITVLVGQALRDGLKKKEEIEEFVARLRAGEAAFEDEASEGRSKSLGASLSYGFEHTFNEEERKRLALLHLFQGFVDVGVLTFMGRAKADWSLPELRGLTRDDGVALLDRAAEIGLLTPLGGGFYVIHPAVPWFFKSLFDRYYPGAASPEAGTPDRRIAAIRAYAEAMGELGTYYHGRYEEGNREVIAALTAEEANFLHARRLAREHGWWGPVVRAMRGLHALYRHTGRRAEWRKLLEEIVPDFVDPATGGLLSKREEGWSMVTQYCVLVAQEARRWKEAGRLQGARIDWSRKRAASALGKPPEKLNDKERRAIRMLAVSLHEMARIRRQQGLGECIPAYEEALSLAERIGDQALAAICAFNLGHAYMAISGLRDLDKAESCYRRSLELVGEGDNLGRGRCLVQLGIVAHQRFVKAREAGKPEAELLKHVNGALKCYVHALKMLPADAVGDLAVAHSQLGVVYGEAADVDKALGHYRDAIRLDEAQANLYGAAQTRLNAALLLTRAGRFRDALDYAKAALFNYESFGDRAAVEAQKTQELIAVIEREMKRGDKS